MQVLSRVVEAKNSMEILNSILCEVQDNVLILVAGDGETTIQTRIEGIVCEGNGKVAFNARLLSDILREMPELPLNFDINEQNFQITMTSENGKYVFVGSNGEEYPQMVREETPGHQFSLSAQVLRTALNKTLFCTANDELRPVMNGVFFDVATDKITVVATDAHRLVRYTNVSAHSEEPTNFILPKKPANILKDLLAKEEGDVEVVFGDKNARFMFADTMIICRQIEGRYPNYNAVIPQNNPSHLTIDRLSLLSAAKRVAVFSAQGTGLLKVELDGTEKVKLSSQDIDFSTSSEEVLPCTYAGEAMKIGFKSSFLVEILAAIQSTEIVLELADASKAGLILPLTNEENEEVLTLIMPMLLND